MTIGHSFSSCPVTRRYQYLAGTWYRSGIRPIAHVLRPMRYGVKSLAPAPFLAVLLTYLERGTTLLEVLIQGDLHPETRL
jgi:hypothetical protein